MLKIANEKVSKVVYLSTMEIYGFPDIGELVDENNVGSLSSLMKQI